MSESFPSNHQEDIPEITPSENHDFDVYRKEIYQRFPDVLATKEKFANFLSVPSFDSSVLIKSIDRWNEKVSADKGFSGSHFTIEEIGAPHGRLDVIHFKGSDSIKFEYVPKAIKSRL